MSVRVYPGAKNPSHQISLSDGIQTWGLRLAGGDQSIKEKPLRPSTIYQGIGESKFGDWEPGMSEIEQRSWEGGRGVEDFVDNPKGFYDSMMAWTSLPGKVFPSAQWKFAKGLRESCEHLPGNMDWQALLDEKRYISVDFTINGTDFDASKASLWLRRIGSPREVTVGVYADNAGEPGAAISNGSEDINILDVPDLVSVFQSIDISAMSDLGASTKYHLVVIGNENDNAANHWEVGIDKNTSGSKYSATGSSWTEGEFKLYFRLVGEDIERKWQLFNYRGSCYAIDERKDGSASSLMLNGDRGKTTSATETTLVDSNKSWTTEVWAGAWVKIIEGKGKNQSREIISNDGTSLEVKKWELQPDSTSLYVIYATAIWQDISPTSGDQIDGVVSDVVVLNEQVHFAQGQDTAILKMRWYEGASPPAHEFDDDGSNVADLLKVMVDETNGLQIWRVDKEAAAIRRANPAAWLTGTSYGSEILIGESDQEIRQIFERNGVLCVFKSDGIYCISPDGKVSRELSEFGVGKSLQDGREVYVKGEEVYFSWGDSSLIHLSGNDHKYIGPDLEIGLPENRKGPISAIIGITEGLLVAVNAGEMGFSSVLFQAYETTGWHEVYRAWAAGKEVSNIYWQNCSGTRPRLWISVGGELVVQEWPKTSRNPLQDSGFNFQHECWIKTASMDMGVARLPKFIKEVSLISENLTTGVEVHLDYQAEDDVGSECWTKAETFYSSPEDNLPILVGNLRKIRFRLRLLTNDAQIPPVVQATVMEGFARIPMKYQWEMEVLLGDMQRDLSGGSFDQDPDQFILWLKQSANEARKVTMRSIWEGLDGQTVIIEPPELERSFTTLSTGDWGGKVRLKVREA
ncbi:MAG: hypothetical protein HON98_02590 [Chloroflexi bacterium]|jgi:hypothetical protein|nr:hypothetical protein [Chloroflexota bacterium]MBT3668730.1 hypothetical protein [Chloroflexota bacterium]MBT4002785.1 hypothetical protein [Chloroflexota bacterium]MBT4305431.1 hypothetical protein [Chloroflexota bacterium]MBT4533042.1 hypothetical protein [Chloroflexota bacterium]